MADEFDGNVIRIDDVEELLSGPSGPYKALSSLLCRQLISIQSGDVEPPDLNPDSSLDVLNRLVEGFGNGTPLDGIKDDISRLTLAQEDRISLVNSLVASHSLVRMVRLMRARDRLERFLLSCSERGDLSANEAMVFMKMVQAELKSAESLLKPPPIKDSDGMVEKTDFAAKVAIDSKADAYAKTTPQGRDIVRKELYRMMRSPKPE